jgi:hypothetical protein
MLTSLGPRGRKGGNPGLGLKKEGCNEMIRRAASVYAPGNESICYPESKAPGGLFAFPHFVFSNWT